MIIYHWEIFPCHKRGKFFPRYTIPQLNWGRGVAKRDTLYFQRIQIWIG